MLVDALQHINIRCANLERTRDFYERVIGLRVGDRPPIASTGYWLYVGRDPVVHLVQRPPGEAVHSNGSGNLDDIAFHGTDVHRMRLALRQEGVAFREAVIPQDNAIQLFLHDPDGVGLEFNFSQ